jgi:serine/threonine protein kinase
VRAGFMLDFSHVACRLLQYHPGKRLTAQQALEHPYFQQQPSPSMNCYPAGYKPRYSSKATREQQRKKPSAAAGGSHNNAAAVKQHHHSAAAGRTNASAASLLGKARSSGANAVKRVEKKGATVKKAKAKVDK